MTFEQALKRVPVFIILDLVGQHFTVSDLRFAVQHEIDLHEEGDIELTAKELRQAKRFLATVKELTETEKS